MPRNDLTLASKIAVLDTIKSQPRHTSHRKLSQLTGVPKSTIYRLIRQESQLRADWALGDEKAGSTKRKREGKNPYVEEALDQWFCTVSGQGMNVTGPILKAKSEELAKALGHFDFKATDGWLSRWKVRHNIKLKKGNGKETKMPSFLESFCPEDIYSAKETGLYYRATPNGSLCFEHTVISRSKTLMDYITVLCCTNMSGSDKRKLLIIGKNCKELKTESLSVEYISNKNAWMTSEIFQNWLENWDAELQQKQRKILLIIDNCTVHPHLQNLDNIKLEFISFNTIALLPMDMGIIKMLKTLYRTKLVNYIQQSIENKSLTISSPAIEISSKINLLLAIQFISESWQSIKTNTIQNSFSVCGLKHFFKLENSNEDIEAIPQLPVVNYQEFINIDHNLSCYDENIDCEEISETKILKDDYDNDDLPEEVSNQDAQKYIVGLQRYFGQIGNEQSPFSALNICAEFVQMQSDKTKIQTTQNI